MPYPVLVFRSVDGTFCFAPKFRHTMPLKTSSTPVFYELWTGELETLVALPITLACSAMGIAKYYIKSVSATPEQNVEVKQCVKAAFHFRVFHPHVYVRKTLNRREH